MAGVPCVLVGKLSLVSLLVGSNSAVAAPVEGNHSLLVGLDSVGVHSRIQRRRFDGFGGNAVLRETIKKPGLHLRSNVEMDQSLCAVCRSPGENVEAD